MAARKLDTEVRKAQIVRVASDILAREGARGLSVAAIAKRVGIVPSAIYRHFRGKDGILDAVLESVADRLAGNLAHAREFSEDALERLESLVEGHARLVRENRGFARLLFSGEFFDGRPERRRRLLDLIDGYLSEIATIVEEGREAGRIREDVDPAAVTLLYLGMIQPPAFLRHISKGERDVTRDVGRAWALVRRSIATGG